MARTLASRCPHRLLGPTAALHAATWSWGSVPGHHDITAQCFSNTEGHGALSQNTLSVRPLLLRLMLLLPSPQTPCLAGSRPRVSGMCLHSRPGTERRAQPPVSLAGSRQPAGITEAGKGAAASQPPPALRHQCRGRVVRDGCSPPHTPSGDWQ